ncbi:MAG: DUF1684 domain-containing protein [Acidobacteriota bacterium]
MVRMPSGRIPGVGLVFLVLSSTRVIGAADDYEAEILRWRQERVNRLMADDGWLTVSGLFWLKEGANTIGADPSSDIVLPAGSAPERVGEIVYEGGRATIHVAEGVRVTADGRPVTTMPLRDDQQETTDILAIGDLRVYVIERSGRRAVRLKDPNSKFRKEFTGLFWYPVKRSFRVTARFVAYDTPREIRVPTILGTVEKSPCPGYVVWRMGGQEVRLLPVVSAPGDDFFFIFKDATSGEETYPGGRFLYAAPPVDGRVILDFNKAYNPPCAFTPYATCPLPPEGNRLDIRVEAGELNYSGH